MFRGIGTAKEEWTEERTEAKRAQNVREGKPPFVGIGGNWSPQRRAEHGRKVSKAIKRVHAIKRRDVDAFLETTEVHESLRPIIEMRSKQAIE